MPPLGKKFSKYVADITVENSSEELVFAEMEKHIRKSRNKNDGITLLSDDFFPNDAQTAAVNTITNASITPYHNHNFYELNFVASGSCAQYIEGKNVMLRTGDLLLLRPDTFHCACPVGESRCFNILLKAEFADRLEKAFRSAVPVNYLSELAKNKVYMIFSSPSPESTEEIILRLAEASEKSKSRPLCRLSAESFAQLLLAEISEYPRYTAAYSGSGHGIEQENRPDLILQYIRSNIMTATLESSASHFGYTPAHFSRLVKKYTGCSFSVFASTQRLLTAEKLLSKTNIPIGNIPAMIGIDSKEYFSRMFKKHNGVSPSQYRQNALKKD